MTQYVINDTRLTAIADAIRGKTGTEDTFTVDEMPAAISGIVGGGGGTDLSTLQTLTVSGASNTTNYSTLPDLTPYVSDFSQIVIMFFSYNGGARLYVRGKAGENGKEVYFLKTSTSSSSNSTQTPAGAAEYLDGDLSGLKLYNGSGTLLTSGVWQYRFYMLYEE